MPLSDEHQRLLETYREKAFERLHQAKYRRRPTEDDVLAVYLIARSYEVPQAVLHQMLRDLKIYLLYDSLAMWLDPKAGLALYAPEAVTEIGEYFLGCGDEYSV